MTPYYQDSHTTVYHSDCESVLPFLPGVEHVITDPPYSEHVHNKSRRGSSLPDAGQYRACISRARDLGFESIKPATMRTVAEYCSNVLRWVLVFSDVELTGEWRQHLTEYGLEYIRTGAWVKLNATPQFTGDRPASAFECITIAHRKGRKEWNAGGRHALWTFPIVINRGGDNPRLHTTQKPVELMAALIRDFTHPGETILDPFAGSGTTAVAAKSLGRKCICIERDEKHCATIVKRLSQEYLPLAQPPAHPSEQLTLNTNE
jgi:DNA modification methylase